ncbi:DNA/RNA non-specific endonuclease [Lachnospiraceae bacterium 47-T17]
MDVIEQKMFMPEGIDIREKLFNFRKNFTSAVSPENGSYGVKKIDKGNGSVALRGKTDTGHPFMEYYQDGKIIRRRESLGGHQVLTTKYDDVGNPYLKTFTGGKNTSYELAANANITKGNFNATTDAFGRVTSTKVTDIKLKEGGHRSVSKLRDSSYLDGDEVGHGVPDQFGGPASKENTYAQAMEVNRGTGSKVRQVENLAAQLKKEGHTVDYEMRANYSGTRNSRPTSFEPRITVDGEELELPENLKKIYNTSKETTVRKVVTNAKERFGTANEVGLKSGVVAAGITCAMSSVDNISACVNGEISGEEAAIEIVKDTAVAGGAAYGTAFISTAVSESMKGSSKMLLQQVGKSCLPSAAVVFAVDSADSIIEFAKGEIDGGELSYELGDSAVSVGGGFAGGSAGAKVGAAVGTAIAPGVGTVAGTVVGGIVGGVVGTVVASEAYATAVEAGTEGAKFLADKAETLTKDTVELVKENMPEKLDEVKSAFNDFAKSCNLPFNI